jgi:hypothetical protein
MTEPAVLTSAEVVAVLDCGEAVHHAAACGPSHVTGVTLTGDLVRVSARGTIDVVDRLGIVPMALGVMPTGEVVGHESGAIIRSRGVTERPVVSGPVATIAVGMTEVAFAAGEHVHRGSGGSVAARIGTVRDLAWIGRRDLFVAVGTQGLAWIDLDRCVVEGVVELATLLTVNVSADGERIVAGSLAGAVHVLAVWGGEGSELEGYPDRVRHVAWTRSDAAASVVAVADDEITVWAVEGVSCADEPTCLHGHEAAITALAAASAHGLLASGDAEGVVRLWRPDRVPEPLVRVDVAASVTALVWTADARHLAVFDRSGRVTVVAVRAGVLA